MTGLDSFDVTGAAYLYRSFGDLCVIPGEQQRGGNLRHYSTQSGSLAWEIDHILIYVSAERSAMLNEVCMRPKHPEALASGG